LDFTSRNKYTLSPIEYNSKDNLRIYQEKKVNEMYNVALYLVALAGSFSLGYGIMRLGFPKNQGLVGEQKAGWGYLFGGIIFIPSIGAAMLFGDIGFFILSPLICFVLAMMMYVMRITGHEVDSTPLVAEETHKREIPQRLLTKEEKERKLSPLSAAPSAAPVRAVRVKDQLSKSDMKLDVKMMKEVKRGTSDLEERDKQKAKQEALDRLRSFARQMKSGEEAPAKTKQAKKAVEEESDEITEEDLKRLEE